MDVLSAKQRFGLIGNNDQLNRAIETALTVAPTHLSVLVTGESGVGKESIPQIIHAYGGQKHSKYVALNCGAIPEGTMDSELFGHVKGSFTGAHAERKGYFEEADGGTIFLDEIAEMPMATQVKLLRVLESGEFIKVGSSKVQKTNVRVIAATNVDIPKAIKNNKFREDLYYRLNTVPIHMPPLRSRGVDIELLFRKFANDFAEKYRMPVVKLDAEAKNVLGHYYWPGNVRQLKNVTEQLSILETDRVIDAATLQGYLPNYTDSKLPALATAPEANETDDQRNERNMLYKVIVDMRKEMNELKAVVNQITQGQIPGDYNFSNPGYMPGNTELVPANGSGESPISVTPIHYRQQQPIEIQHEVEENLSLEEKEKELIKKALNKHRGKRKYAAQDLGISERTLYRKIKEYDLNE
jgi:transcriptional regulator with PAS, ATPase and Fis domain